MSAAIRPLKHFSFETAMQWMWDWSRRNFMQQFRYCGDKDVERMAGDIRISVGEFRELSRKGRLNADLLQRRLALLGLDQARIWRTTPATFQDLQRVCSMCEQQRRCSRDLASEAGGTLEKYCPNTGTLKALAAFSTGGHAH
jgi:hypothetical protein